MGVRQTPPEAGEGRLRVHHTYVETKPGTQWTGYVAGPTFWVCCHTKGKSKPCLDAVTDGELTCARCGEITPPETIGYVPLYRESDSKPVMVVVHEYTRETVDALAFHRRVLVGREKAKSDGVYVVAHPTATPRFVSTLAIRQRPVSLIECLLRVWGYPELQAWHYATEGLPNPGCITPPPAKPILKPSLAPVDLPPSVSAMDETASEAIMRLRARARQHVAPPPADDLGGRK